MTTTMETVTKWQDEMLTMTKKVETPVVRYTGEMAEWMAKYMPHRPAFMAKMPTMTEVVDNGLKFRRRMVDQQAAFVHKMMKAMDPMLMKFEAMPKHHDKAHVAKPVARVAPRRTTKAA